MEFFRSVDIACDESDLQARLTVAALPQFCSEIGAVQDIENEQGRMQCLWGSFVVRRDLIRGGVRFHLPDCPNALAWTITTDLPPAPETVVLHATINRQEHDPDFIESIELFLDEWAVGLGGLPEGGG
ncbi:MAG: hypothetical protein Q9M41_00525 [Paracoccaceae bacterium]|nr:hypothetical protein [Paracoccaceae bacterium]